jgi:23S rRNA (adenine2503-C2)-methyltransferase
MLQQTKGETLVGMDLADLEKLLGPEQPSFRARQLFDALYKKRVDNLSNITNLPQSVRGQLFATYPLGLPATEHRYDSADGTRRYLLRLEDSRTVEAVLMPEPGRHTICISSQVGCPVDCRFCLTALMGLERNLTAGEIVGQVLYVARENGIEGSDKHLNIVMMGMGEPLPRVSSPIEMVSAYPRNASRSPLPGSSPRWINWGARPYVPDWLSLSTPPQKSSGAN